MSSNTAMGRAAALAFAVVALFPLTSFADDETAKPATGTPLKYEDAKAADSEIQALWKGWGGDYLSKDNPSGYIVLAKFKDAKGRDVMVSQIGSLSVCGATTCPVRVSIDGELVDELLACDAQDYHVLVPSKRAVFFCDIAVPLETKADKAEAGRK